MQSNWKAIYSVAVCLTVLALGGSARGSTETFTVNVPAQTTDFTAYTTLDQFNPALGTLTSVSMSLSTSGTMGGNVTNNSASAQTFQVTESSAISLSSTDAAITGLSGLDQTLMEKQTYTALGVGAPSPFGPYSPTASAGPITFTNLTPFLGTGTLPFTLSTSTGTITLGGGGNTTSAIMTTEAGTETITYTYNPTTTAVPEPASLILGLTSIAGGGLIWFIRRKKRSN